MSIKTRYGGVEATSTYIVTDDLFAVICRWCAESCSIRNPEKILNREFFNSLLKNLTLAIKTCCFADENVEVVGLSTKAFDDLLTKHEPPNRKKEFKEFWVSLDDVYPKFPKGCESKYNISITRYIQQNMEDFDKDRFGNEREDMGRGPRPESNSPSLDVQVRECVNKYVMTIEEHKLNEKEYPLVLVDDGTWHGKTIVAILKKFAAQEHSFTSVRLGVAHMKGIETISGWKELDKKNNRIYRVPFIGASKLCPPLKDWVCERDFFPGVLYGGRVVGEEDEKGNLSPLKVDSLPIRAQYLHDWGKPIWASIEKGEIDFTITALRLSIRLWDYLSQDVLGKDVRVKDLPAIPLKLYGDYQQRGRELLENSWIGLLKSKCEELILRHGDPRNRSKELQSFS